jgi:hypothetical protein
MPVPWQDLTSLATFVDRRQPTAHAEALLARALDDWRLGSTQASIAVAVLRVVRAVAECGPAWVACAGRCGALDVVFDAHRAHSTVASVAEAAITALALLCCKNSDNTMNVCAHLAAHSEHDWPSLTYFKLVSSLSRDSLDDYGGFILGRTFVLACYVRS